MTLTLTRERRKKFEAIIQASDVYHYALSHLENLGQGQFAEQMVKDLANELAEAAESRTERKTDETQGEYNVEVFRGDWRQYPEHLHKIAEVLRDTWKFVLPDKPQKGEGKGKYKYYVMAMDDLKQACAEFGADVLVQVHADWRAGFKNGLAPYTVAQPSSLVNMALAKARELREKGMNTPVVKKDKHGIVESW